MINWNQNAQLLFAYIVLDRVSREVNSSPDKNITGWVPGYFCQAYNIPLCNKHRKTSTEGIGTFSISSFIYLHSLFIPRCCPNMFHISSVQNNTIILLKWSQLNIIIVKNLRSRNKWYCITNSIAVLQLILVSDLSLVFTSNWSAKKIYYIGITCWKLRVGWSQWPVFSKAE